MLPAFPETIPSMVKNPGDLFFQARSFLRTGIPTRFRQPGDPYRKNVRVPPKTIVFEYLQYEEAGMLKRSSRLWFFICQCSLS